MTNIIIISHSIIPSVLLCGHAQLSYLKKKGEIDYKFIEARKTNSEVLSWADIVVFVRSESYLEAYASELCKGKKHLVYVMDDDLLNLPDYISCAKYYKIPGIHNNILKIMSNCDTFLTPSRILLKKYGSNFKYADLIDEPSLNSIKEKKQNDIVKIGFAGSIDRTQDINEILTGALEEIIKKYKEKISVEFMGAKPELVDKYKLKYIPYQNGYKKYTQIVGEANWDIGLAPMPISDFHSCKYFNKYVEYASFGIAGIYTNCEPYIHGIKNEENGLLVNNTKQEWIEGLSKLIDNIELREKISHNCINEALNIYSLDNLSKQYIQRISKNIVERDKEIINITFKTRAQIFEAMLKDKIMVQRWHFPFWVIKFVVLKLLEKSGLWKKKENNVDWEI